MREVMRVGRRERRWYASLAVAAVLVPLHSVRGDLPNRDVLDQVSASVVQIYTEGCTSGSRVGTGFVWGQPSQVVTTLHLVGDCTDIYVWFERQGVQRRASIAKTLKHADLALLEVVAGPDVPTLRVSPIKPSLHEDLIALGYPLRAPSIHSKEFRVSYGESTLEKLVPASVKEEIARTGSPSLSLTILRLEGHLLPGLSGAPIVNRDGLVVGVGDGGLENGAASISWGLPASYLDVLARSMEEPARASAMVTSLFAAELEADPGEAIRCGDVIFTKVRTRPFEDLIYSADDPASLISLTMLSAIVQVDVSYFTYDVYQNLETGATIAIPSGIRLRERTHNCVSDGIAGLMTLSVQGTRVTSVVDREATLLEWVQQLFPSASLEWKINSEFSYTAPQSRFDGLLVNRVALDALNGQTEESEGEAFVTWMARGDALVAVVARSAFTPDEKLVEQCIIEPSAPDCEEYMPIMANWIALVIGVFLSTFPIG